MPNTLKLLLAFTLFVSTNSIACESTPKDWKLTSYKCPRECSDILKNLMESQLGNSINFTGKTPWVSGTSDSCHRVVKVEKRKVDVHKLLREINDGRPPKQSLSLAELGLEMKDPWVKDVLCTGPEGQQVSHRFIQSQTGKLIALDEETSILIYE